MLRQRAAFIGVIAIGLGGCLYEPYPAIHELSVPQDQTPEYVLASFADRFPHATIRSITARQFRNRTTGYTIVYCEGGQEQQTFIVRSERP